MKEKIYNIIKKSLNVFWKILIILSFLSFLIVPFLHKLLDETVGKCMWYPSCAIFTFSFVKSMCKTDCENKKNIFETLAWMSFIPMIVIFSSAFVINYYDTNYNWFWCVFVLILIYFPVLVLGMRNFYKKENNYTAKELKTSAINALKYILFYLLLDFFYMAIFNYWISNSNSKDIWLTLQFIFGIAAMVLIFYNLTIAFLSISKKNWFGLLQDFVLGIAITVYLIFIIPDSSLQSVVLTIIAAVYGGLLTLVGVAWTIKDTNHKRQEDINRTVIERQEEERKKHIPYVKISYENNEPIPEVNAHIIKILDLENPNDVARIYNNTYYMINVKDFVIKNISKENIILKGILVYGEFYGFSRQEILESNKFCRIKASNNWSLCVPNLDERIVLVVNDILENTYEIECNISKDFGNYSYLETEIADKKYKGFNFDYYISAVGLPKLIKSN